MISFKTNPWEDRNDYTKMPEGVKKVFEASYAKELESKKGIVEDVFTLVCGDAPPNEILDTLSVIAADLIAFRSDPGILSITKNGNEISVSWTKTIPD